MSFKNIKKIKAFLLSLAYIALLFLAPFVFHLIFCNFNVAYADNKLSNSSCIVFNEEYYVRYVKTIEATPLDFEGKSILTYGIVLKPYKTSKGFYLSRVYLWCCAADATTIGFPVEWAASSSLKEGEWVKVTGLIAVKNSKSSNSKNKYSPYIQATSVSKISRLKSQYVY